MGKGFEAAAFSAPVDKTQDNSMQLAAAQWDPRDRALYGANNKKDDGVDAYTVFNVAKMVPTTFGAFASEAGRAAPGINTLGGLGIVFGADYLIDKTFFNDQPIRGGSLAFDFVAPAAMMMTPFAMRYKAAAAIGSHVVGKLIDKYGK